MVEIIELPHPHLPEAETLANLFSQWTSSVSPSTVTSSVSLPIALHSSAVRRRPSLIVNNNSPFYSNVGYNVSQALPNAA